MLTLNTQEFHQGGLIERPGQTSSFDTSRGFLKNLLFPEKEELNQYTYGETIRQKKMFKK